MECLMALETNLLRTDKMRQLSFKEKTERMMLLLQLLKKRSNSL